MTKIEFLLFAIPILSMVVIGLYQFFDEMFKKKFVLERRGTGERPAAGAPRRRFSDSVPPGTLRNPESSAANGAPAEVKVAQVHGA
jgi:hypothetical protein